MARRAVEVELKEAAAAWTDKRNWEPLHRQVYEFALPQRNPYYSGDASVRPTGGQSKQDRVFDATLANATVKLANRLQSELCRPGTKWAKFTLGKLLEGKVPPEAVSDLERIEEAVFAAMHISSFDTAINEWFLNLACPGTAVMGVLEGGGQMPVDYVCIPEAQCAFREGPNGQIWGVYRKHRMMVALIKDTWTEAKVPAKLLEQTKDEPDADVELDECLYFDRLDNRWWYSVIWKDGGTDAKGGERLVERFYVDGYWVVARWLKAPGETHGRGPAIQALPDAKTLNKLKELLLMNASLAVKGVWLVRNDSVISPGTVTVRPGAHIPVRNIDQAMKRLDVYSDLQLAQLIVEDLVSSINQAMLNKSLPPETGAVRSATEIVQRLKELQQDLGAPLGRIITEGLMMIMRLTLGVLGRAGVIPLAPNGQTLPLDGANIKLELRSPLVQTQNLADVEATVQWLEIQKGLLPDEAYMLGTKVEDVAEYLAKKLGVTKELYRSQGERVAFQQVMAGVLNQQMGGGAGVVANAPAVAGAGGGVVPAGATVH